MAETKPYEHGVPCWVDHTSAEPQTACEFYSSLFGWEGENRMPPEQSGQYFMFELDGKPVAATSGPEETAPPHWSTYIAVEDADATAERITTAGGRVMAEPFDVFDAGRMAIAADPTGAVFSIWQAGRHPGAGIVNEPVSLCWVELATREPELAADFYAEIFGWGRDEINADTTPYSLWTLQGREAPVGGMTEMRPEQWPAETPAHWGICFAVNDTDETAESCERFGGSMRMPPFDTEFGRTAVLTDPIGAGFAVIRLNPREGEVEG